MTFGPRTASSCRERINTPHRFQRVRTTGGPALPWGLQNRLARIIRSDGHTAMLAADDGYFLGRTHKLEMPRKILQPLAPFADAIMVTRGLVGTSVDRAATRM